MTLNIGRAIKRATTVSSEMKKGWKSGKKKPKPKPSSSKSRKQRKPQTQEQKNKTLKGMGLKPVHYWSEQFKNFKSK